MSTYALAVRDALYTRVMAMPFFDSFHFATNKALQIQPQSIPFAGVYLIEEVGTPEGDANEGDVRLRTGARYGISVIVQNNDAAAAQNKLDQAMVSLYDLLLDPTLLNWDGLSGPAKIQGFTRTAISHHFGSIGLDNEWPVAELRFDLSCDLGTLHFDPVCNDDLKLVHLETRYPPGESSEVQQIIAAYDIPTGFFLLGSSRMRVRCSLVADATVV